MFRRSSGQWVAILLLQLKSLAWSADVSRDASNVFKEDEQGELCMMQSGAHVVQTEHGQGKTTKDSNSTRAGVLIEADSSVHIIEDLKSKLAYMQQELDQELEQHQRLLEERAHVLAQRQVPEGGRPDEGVARPDEGSEAGLSRPDEEAMEEHFEEIALEIKEAKIVSCCIIAMIIVFVLTHVMHDLDIHVLPEAVMIIIVGIFLGLALKYQCKSRFMVDSEFRSEMAIQMLNEIFLPMLMLEAGWSVRRMDFISQLPYILNFAVLGTIISTVVIGYLIYKSGQAEYHQIKSVRGSFIIASLISATDPVATLGTYSELKVDPLLNIIVFGEAAINDAVAIVIFTFLNDDYIMNSYNNYKEMAIFGSMKAAKTLSCSFLLGCTVSAIICMLLKVVKLRRNKKIEILVVVFGGYLSYALGEYFQVSGIICTLFNGMFMGKYSKYHLSAEGTLLTSFYISQMSTIMDSGIFLLSGVCCVCLSWTGRTLGLWLMLFCAIARIASTVPCGLLSNLMKRTIHKLPFASEGDIHILTPKYLFMIWHAGLRGGIAENLALQIGEWLDAEEGPGAKEAVRSSVFMLVCTYVIIFGGTTKIFLNLLGIQMGSDYAQDVLSKTEMIATESTVIDFLHNKIFFPLLVGSDADDQNKDVIDMGDSDVIDVLHEVCHGHRGGCMSKKDVAPPVTRRHFLSAVAKVPEK